MSRKKSTKKPDDRPPVKFDVRIPIRPDANPKDPSQYRTLGPDERLPPEYAEPMLKHIARVFVDSLEEFGIRVKDIPKDQFGEVYKAWWGFFWEPKKAGEPVGPKSKVFLEMLIGILERKVGSQADPS
ncbi:MAG TPA: hypothetical protein VHR66_31420 [Gemmataceae bacterium]|nr:hypothetical protein [Gemmataceae bacterium]